MKKIYSDKAPKPVGPYSQAIEQEGLIYTCGQIGLGTDGNLAEGGIKEQTRQAIQNLSNILEEAGSNLGKAIKTTVYLKDMKDFPEMNSVYAEMFGDSAPARSTLAASGLPKDALVEIDVIACK